MLGLFFNDAIMLNEVTSFNPQINYWSSFSFSYFKYLNYLHTLVVLKSFSPLTSRNVQAPFSQHAFIILKQSFIDLCSYYKEA